MSFDLVIWEGPRPASDEEAAAQHERLAELEEEGVQEEPTPGIRAFVDALLARWPDIHLDAGEHSPWSDGPLIANASGGSIHLAMQWSRAEEASAFVVSTAVEHGLVCFDPQSETLRPHREPAPQPEPAPPLGRTRARRWFRR